VVCLDNENRPAEIPQNFREIPDFHVKPIPEDLGTGLKFHTVLVCNQNFFAINDPRLIVGQNLLQIRQLEKIGYKVHMVSEMW